MGSQLRASWRRLGPGLYKGARLYLRALADRGAPVVAAGFLIRPSSPPSASPAPLVDNLLLAYHTMTLEEVRCQDTVPESTARWVGVGCRTCRGAGNFALSLPRLVGREP